MSFANNPKNAVTYVSDPSHGYLKVPVDLVEKLGFANKISEYSFFNDKFVWLEEDCDMALFFDALDEKFLPEPIIFSQTLDEPAPFRLYPRFSAKDWEV
jgi:hypothetical protein